MKQEQIIVIIMLFFIMFTHCRMKVYSSSCLLPHILCYHPSTMLVGGPQLLQCVFRIWANNLLLSQSIGCPLCMPCGQPKSISYQRCVVARLLLVCDMYCYGFMWYSVLQRHITSFHSPLKRTQLVLLSERSNRILYNIGIIHWFNSLHVRLMLFFTRTKWSVD